MESEETNSHNILVLLRTYPNVRRFLGACAQSQIGSGAAYVALILVAYERLHTPWAISLVLLADFIPGIFTSFFFGRLADRWPRRRLVVCGDLIRCLAFVAIALLPWFSTTILFALVAGLGSSMFIPAANAALPTITPAEHRNIVTTVYNALQNSMILLGPAVAAILLLFLAPSGVLIINAATFLISALVLIRVDLGRGMGNASETNEETEQGPRPRFSWSLRPQRARLRTELAAVHAIRGMTALIMLSGLLVLTSGVINVAEPLLAKTVLHGGNSAYAILLTGYGLGMLLSSFLSAHSSSALPMLRGRWLLSFPVIGLGMLFSSASPTLLFAFAAFFITGFGDPLTVVPEMRLMQELSDEGLFGRVFGLRETIRNSSFAGSYLLAGVLVGLVGVRGVFAVGGVLTLLLFPLAMIGFRLSRRADAPAPLPKPAGMPDPTAKG